MQSSKEFGDFRVLPIPYKEKKTHKNKNKNMVDVFLNISFVVLLDRPMCTSRWLAYFLSTKGTIGCIQVCGR